MFNKQIVILGLQLQEIMRNTEKGGYYVDLKLATNVKDNCEVSRFKLVADVLGIFRGVSKYDIWVNWKYHKIAFVLIKFKEKVYR